MAVLDEDARQEVRLHTCLSPSSVMYEPFSLLQARNSRLDALEADNYMEETGERGDDAAYVDSEVHTHRIIKCFKSKQISNGWNEAEKN